MAKEELGDVSTATLEKRKTFATVILGILVGLTGLNIIAAAVAKRPELFAVAAAMFAVGYPIYAGRQRVEAELHSRDDR